LRGASPPFIPDDSVFFPLSPTGVFPPRGTIVLRGGALLFFPQMVAIFFPPFLVGPHPPLFVPEGISPPFPPAFSLGMLFLNSPSWLRPAPPFSRAGVFSSSWLFVPLIAREDYFPSSFWTGNSRPFSPPSVHFFKPFGLFLLGQKPLLPFYQVSFAPPLCGSARFSRFGPPPSFPPFRVFCLLREHFFSCYRLQRTRAEKC